MRTASQSDFGDTKVQKLKMKYSGAKAGFGSQAHELTYQMRKGDSEMDVSLYFDTETYRHVATVYQWETPENPGKEPPPVADSPLPDDTAARLGKVLIPDPTPTARLSAGPTPDPFPRCTGWKSFSPISEPSRALLYLSHGKCA